MTKTLFGRTAVVRVGILPVLAVLGGLVPAVRAADPPPPAAETKPATDPKPPAEAKGTPPAATTAEDSEYRIGIEDILAISVWRDPDLTREVPVRPDGRISLPLLQDIDAAGKTPKELAQDIQRRLKEFLSNPSVTVIVREVNSLKAYMMGEVLKPGPILLRSPVRLLQGIALAGGLTPYGGRASVVLYRKTATGEKVIELSYREIVGGRKPEDNLMLEPGDTVVVR
ncbi:MAG TPA: polysaccharide biosynthesis/export family protein [Candidatus Polarisedimenticolia bacterium]|nr:polysaccharide biosynthesis/export family protein [Candidatus Polarisedimenticolia bacterium]